MKYSYEPNGAKNEIKGYTYDAFRNQFSTASSGDTNSFRYCGGNPVMFVNMSSLEHLVVYASEYDGSFLNNRYKYNKTVQL